MFVTGKKRILVELMKTKAIPREWLEMRANSKKGVHLGKWREQPEGLKRQRVERVRKIFFLNAGFTEPIGRNFMKIVGKTLGITKKKTFLPIFITNRTDNQLGREREKGGNADVR